MPRAFRTTWDDVDTAEWEPLERVALLARKSPDLPSFHPGEFMYMLRLSAPRRRHIHLYKHYDTRRYLNLDDGGHAYEYCGWTPDQGDRSGGMYRQHRSLADAIDRLDLWLFELERPMLRSFPPEAWPPDELTSDAKRPYDLPYGHDSSAGPRAAR
ncbi:MAG: hypothetical protein U5K29_06710 [Acidimicrobiales bacterium]|nr:hypothetical protein [Acidimicrobiales bacterium]